LIKKITDKDKEDWENFLNNKKKNLNKNSLKKKRYKKSRQRQAGLGKLFKQ
jgi:hypothetical protein